MILGDIEQTNILTQFGGATPLGPPQIDPPKLIFWMAQLRVPVCYDISRYLTDKYFAIVWGCPPGNPLKIKKNRGPPKKYKDNGEIAREKNLLSVGKLAICVKF